MGLTYSSVIDAGRDEVFSWHTRPGAITRLTPPWQPVTVLREAGSLRDGRAILSLPGGLRWVAAHQPDAYDPPNSFADELTSLPLPWRHDPLTVAVTGSSGLIGTALTALLTTSGHRVVPLVRGFGPRLLLGAEGAREIAQASQHVRPERLIQAGHQFRQPELDGALRHLFGRGT